ncbi:CinA family protein [Algiphilus sp.]|uniref:CinA family protein n=1 Tax=Algiphilus sp. TaxID=1872431 RepID=UPI0025BC47B3|nr:CinA family protein [Algiphilus sp.]MCK5770085.1 CinA family protein [Algiphilus sp.]
MSSPDPIPETVARIARILTARGQWLATAESCTGGGIATACTDLAGSSGWFERAMISYSNRAKQEMLGVDPGLIRDHGAVSEAVVRAMATGALQYAPVHWSIAVSGIAGPSGGSADKPVGTVWFGWSGPDGTDAECRVLPGDRAAVRTATVAHALAGLLARL